METCIKTYQRSRTEGNNGVVYRALMAHCVLHHYTDVIMSAMASQITSLTIDYSTLCSRRRSKKTSKLRVTGLWEGNSLVTGEFPAQRTSNVEKVSIWWRHHDEAGFPASMITLSHVKPCHFLNGMIYQYIFLKAEYGFVVTCGIIESH